MRARAARMTMTISARASAGRMPLVLLGCCCAALLRRPRNSIAAMRRRRVAAIAILVNALFMQSGPHPAPIFANKPVPSGLPSRSGPALLPRSQRPANRTEVSRASRPRSDMVAEIQRELGQARLL